MVGKGANLTVRVDRDEVEAVSRVSDCELWREKGGMVSDWLEEEVEDVEGESMTTFISTVRMFIGLAG